MKYDYHVRQEGFPFQTFIVRDLKTKMPLLTVRHQTSEQIQSVIEMFESGQMTIEKGKVRHWRVEQS